MNPELYAELCETQPEALALLRASEDDQSQAGYVHTLREILQQPATWLDTAERLMAQRSSIEEQLAGAALLVLTGSGSSQFAGECVAPVLQKELSISAAAIDGGALLLHGPGAMPPHRPALVVSLARSGNSPESVAAVTVLLESAADIRHLVLTCNREGALARSRGDCVTSVVLDGRTNDRSLVMTSSFTNLVLAARFLGLVSDPERYRALCCHLSQAGRYLLTHYFGALARIARAPFDRAVYLVGGPGVGAARESCLKMLEMTAGRVATMTQTYLALRHGPMSFINERTLVVCYLSADRHLREYEVDLVRELNRKKLGAMKLLMGEGIDRELLTSGDEALEIPGMSKIGDENAAVLQVLTGQMLAFFRCRAEGLKPDSPSENGVISRVVEEFPIYRRGNGIKR